MTKRLIISVISLSCLSLPLFGQVEQSQEVAATPAKKAVIPTGYAHDKGYVISPYPPYNVLNVKHLRPGNAAYDPTTAKVDAKTGKPDLSTAKIFIVPEPKKVKVTTSSSTSQ